MLINREFTNTTSTLKIDYVLSSQSIHISEPLYYVIVDVNWTVPAYRLFMKITSTILLL